VATSGDYNDLENKPNIPSDVTELADRVDQLEGDVQGLEENKADKSTLATVATTGSYNDLTDKPEIPTDVQELVGKVDQLDEEMDGKADKSDTYTKEEVDDLISDISYTPIAISSFTASVTKAEQGSTVPSITLSYKLNKAPASATLDGLSRALPGKEGTVPDPTGLPLTGSKTWRLAVADSGSASHAASSDSRTASISFQWKRYWGVAPLPEEVDDEFLLNLDNSELATSRAKVFTVDAGPGEHIWYAVPEAWGECTMSVSGFPGGFPLAALFEHTNESGGKTGYRVYRSQNPSLGDTTVTVS
jgi:outer membrane murein-binding lipoprotein Lpp